MMDDDDDIGVMRCSACLVADVAKKLNKRLAPGTDSFNELISLAHYILRNDIMNYAHRPACPSTSSSDLKNLWPLG